MRILRLVLTLALTLSLPFLAAPLIDSLHGDHVPSRHTSAHVLTGSSVSHSVDIPTAVAQNTLPVAVDGTRNPELIPDDLAYRHFVQAASVRRGAGPGDLGAQDALLNAAGLVAPDRQAIAVAVANVKDDLDRIEQLREHASTLDHPEEALSHLKLEQDRIVTDAVDRITSSISVEGQSALRRFIRDRVKRHIIIYGTAPVNAGMPH